MDYERAVKDLRDIRSTMTRSAARFSRHSGWFFLIQGLVWFTGFLVTQFLPAIAAPVWITTTTAAIILMFILGHRLFGRGSRQRQDGLGPHIVAGVLGVVLFDALIIVLLHITEPEQITLLTMLSAGFCNFLVGLFTRPIHAAMGLLMMLGITVGALLWPSLLYFTIAIFGGGTFIGFGIATLLQKEGADA